MITSGPEGLGGHFSRDFEDFTVGDRFVSGGRTITETDVVTFSVWTGDTLPSHMDRHWSAENAIHGRRVANGLLVISYTLGLLPIAHSGALALRRMQDIVLKRPTFLGDTIHAEGEVVDLRRLGDFGCVVTRIAGVNHDGERVFVGRFEMLWRVANHARIPLAG